MGYQQRSVASGWARFLVGLSLALAICAGSISSAYAQGGQTVVGSGTAASCTLASLKAALNSTFDPLLVTFNCGTSPVVIPVTSTITFPNISGSPTNITIDGGAAGLITLSGSSVRILDQTYLQNLTVKYLTFSNGATAAACTPICGGAAIYNPGRILTVVDSTFTGNTTNSLVSDPGGAAIYSSGPLSITGSTFTNNQTTGGHGGAVYANNATITNSRFANNRSVVGGGSGGRGGALYAAGAPVDGTTMTISGSSFTGNTAGDRGGAIYKATSIYVHSFGLANSTFSGNNAQVAGGALSLGVVFTNGTVRVTNTTISGNSVVSGTGAGIDGTPKLLANSIVANNSPGGNCSTSIPDGGGNVVFSDTSCPGFNGDPVLGTLTGTVPYLPLGAGSAAINRGVATTCAAAVGAPSYGASALDQRGLSRRTAYCDSGAVEAQPASLAVVAGSSQSTAINTAFGTVLQAQVLDAFNNKLSGSFVTFTGPGSGAGITSGSVNLSGASGIAYFGATANATVGAYTAAASTPGVTSVNFSLTNRNPYSVTYNGNGNTGGAVPVDSNYYAAAANVTALGNTGALTRINATFGGWNTAPNGSGNAIAAGASFAINANSTLYAQWIPITSTVSYDANGSTGGTAPADGNTYAPGATAVVLANTGALVKTGYTFAGWNSTAAGTGVSYPASGGSTLTIGSSNLTLYAKWINPCTLDVDGNNQVDALTDGLLLLRAMFGLTGTAVTNGAIGGGSPTRTTWDQIQPHLNGNCAASFSP